MRRSSLRAGLCALAVAVAASALPAKARAETSSVHAALDEVVLRDGRTLVGRVLEQRPGQWVMLRTEDGRRRTFAWSLVEEVTLSTRDEDEERALLEAARRAWQRRANGGMTYELRAALTGALLPRRRFELSGTCATGTGLAPVSMYGQAASDRGRAFGGGLGGRTGYVYIPAFEPGAGASFWGMRAALGLDLHALYAHLPAGLKAVQGDLCAQVVGTQHPVDSRSDPILLLQAPLALGVHLGLGRFDGPMRWRGVVLGLAWAPALLHAVGPGRILDSHLDLVAVEVSADFTTLHAAPDDAPTEAHLRVSVSFAPSTDERQIMVGTLAFGAVWY